MSIGFQVLKKCTNQLATARYDRESAVQGDSHLPGQNSIQSCLDTILEVPVGYEDELGFHCGQPQAQEIHQPVSEPENIFANPYPF